MVGFGSGWWLIASSLFFSFSPFLWFHCLLGALGGDQGTPACTCKTRKALNQVFIAPTVSLTAMKPHFKGPGWLIEDCE
ncbi:MAG: hypothetical protein AT716_03980 [Vulcanisaeta sp. MG_3]|nr:MAG: hypothetical protein AT716_03980 [Vulcanisaeta sp. MG_3]